MQAELNCEVHVLWLYFSELYDRIQNKTGKLKIGGPELCNEVASCARDGCLL